MSSISTLIFSIILINYLLGIYNGAKGRIVGFGFSSSNDYVYSTSVLSQDGSKMEIPIVFVKMDQDLGFSILSTMVNIYYGKCCTLYACLGYIRKIQQQLP